jgi:hypothetical protein
MRRVLALVFVVALVATSGAQASSIAERVRAMPRATSIAEVADYIAGIADGELELAWAAYVWVTDNIAYDVDSYFRGTSTRYDAEGVFKTGKSVCSGYSALYRELCERLGLDAVEIAGWSKGYGYRDGDRFTQTNHAWNAVSIGGEWLLVDTTWGAGSVDGRDFIKDFTAFWFGTAPELFVYWHLPEDADWQLMRKPITLREYERMRVPPTYTGEALWELGFEPQSIVEAIRSGDVATAYGYDAGPLRVVSGLGAVGTVRAGVELSIVVEAPDCDQVAVINGSSWHFLKRSGSTFSIKLKPVRGPLSLNAHEQGSKEPSFQTVLEYVVK